MQVYKPLRKSRVLAAPILERAAQRRVCRWHFMRFIEALRWPLARHILLALLLLVVAGCGNRSAPEQTSPQAAAPTRLTTATAVETPIRFVDATRQSGLHFRHNNGAFGAKWTPDTMGSGVAFIDFDGDGYQDIFFVNGRNWTQDEIDQYRKKRYPEQQKKYNFVLPPNKAPQRTPGALYHNNRDGTFSDVTKNSGLESEMYGMGAAVGDYDNDGRDDLFVTALERSFLFHNQGHGKFREVAARAGVSEGYWATSATWLDYDRDGKLDLFVCHYANWRPYNDAYTSFQGQKSVSGPEFYAGQSSHLYRNLGAGRFKDVSASSGIGRTLGKSAAPLLGKALGVSICDLDNDLWPDIAVANDHTPNWLFRNQGDGTFREVGEKSGLAHGMSGQARAGMGIDAGDFDGSNRESLLITNFSNEMVALYRNLGNDVFTDVAPTSTLGRASFPYLGFGCAFADVDNDGWLDILVANGHVNDIDLTRARQPILLFHNAGPNAIGGRFQEIGAQTGSALRAPIMGRGLACADIDLDGDLDFVVSTNGEAARLLLNQSNTRNRALRVQLRGTKSNRDGIGAVVWGEFAQRALRRRVRSGSSYLSQSELPVVLGLDGAAKADVSVRWPSGKLAHFKDVAAGQIITVDEDKGIVQRQALREKR